MTAYYNEHDPFAAAWLRELIKAGHIAPGEVDERSIEDVFPNDLRGFTQCHFFAGIGVWSYALRQAGWPDDRPVWTGSCPCQPFSAAGKRKGTADERHLWPAIFHLIEQSRPPVFFGEQVSSKDGLTWFDTVSTDMEGTGYSVGAMDLCAAGFGAPHIRQRLYFVGALVNSSSEQVGFSRRSREQRETSSSPLDNATSPRRFGTVTKSENETRNEARLCMPSERGEDSGLADPSASSDTEGRQTSLGDPTRILEEAASTRPECCNSELANSSSLGQSRRRECDRSTSGLQETLGSDSGSQTEKSRLTGGFWAGADWIDCLDGRQRPVEPGTFPLAHGAPARVGRLRGYGNALVAPVATGFIEAFLEVERDSPR